ncbi:hypothetical protein HGRIS_005948 [Hohenbuehelia grisea]|uniref:IgA peptidase M64-domain-containing protein n=1 Tax=Hohenbuehelia grisea TaxID=104357 RepID=A0ABR3K0S0_9AGAR
MLKLNVLTSLFLAVQHVSCHQTCAFYPRSTVDGPGTARVADKCTYAVRNDLYITPGCARHSQDAIQSPFMCADESAAFQCLKASGRPQEVLGQPADQAHGTTPPPPLEVESLIVSGPAENRIDLVFFSDGYLPEERGKFLDDAMRLAQDISGNQTFNTVKPLLNFWAAFSPSNESGIGVGGVPKDTPFGLYRDGTELRGVYYDKPDAAAAACSSLGVQCDYPILLGNDPLYGGLGGRFTVITSSLENGPLVLRHELGHSIINVGEEYDGGFAYFGPNAATNLEEPLPWTQWLTKPNDTHVQRSVMPFQVYPWTILNTTTPWSLNFTSSGTFSRHLIRFSLSGLPEASDLKVELDGTDLKWTPRKDIGVDRWHYDVHRNSSLSGGIHEVKFTLLNKDRQGVAQLCSAESLEFGDESEFVSTPGYYGIYPTYSETNETSYRPTNEDCLMRVVTTPNFCKACIEGLWLALLRKVNLIDSITDTCETVDDRAIRFLHANLVPLAHLRQDTGGSSIPAETYKITWRKDGKELSEFANMTIIGIEDSVALGNYTVEAAFSTEEVRVDKDGLLTKSANHTIASSCSPST